MDQIFLTVLNNYNKKHFYLFMNVYIHNLTNIEKNKHDKFNFIRYKFEKIKMILCNNCNISDFEKNKMLDIFNKCQKFIFGMYKLKIIIRNNNSKLHDHKYDINFNLIETLNSRQLVKINENNIIYTFNLCDLTNIINNSLSYNVDMFSEPSVIKNPYTNIEFSKGAMIEIYNAYKLSYFKTPILFDRYYECFFNIELFGRKNEHLIREHIIKTFMISSIDERKLKYIRMMISYFNKSYKSTFKININNEFPKKILINTFESFLKLYMDSFYINGIIRSLKRRKLLEALKVFRDHNPLFGRKIRIMNIKKLLAICQYYEKYSCSKFDFYYIPPVNLIDVEKKCYYIGETSKVISIFTLKNNEYIEKHILNTRIINEKYNYLFKPYGAMKEANEFVPPVLTCNELYFGKQNSIVLNDDSSSDDDDDNDDFEHIIYGINNDVLNSSSNSSVLSNDNNSIDANRNIHDDVNREANVSEANVIHEPSIDRFDFTITEDALRSIMILYNDDSDANEVADTNSDIEFLNEIITNLNENTLSDEDDNMSIDSF